MLGQKLLDLRLGLKFITDNWKFCWERYFYHACHSECHNDNYAACKLNLGLPVAVMSSKLSSHFTSTSILTCQLTPWRQASLGHVMFVVRRC